MSDPKANKQAPNVVQQLRLNTRIQKARVKRNTSGRQTETVVDGHLIDRESVKGRTASAGHHNVETGHRESVIPR